MKGKYVIFDLDDTLMYEIDFLKSAYQEIAKLVDEKNQEELYQIMFSKYEEGENVFDYLDSKFPQISKEYLLDIYRNHLPNIKLSDETSNVIQNFIKNGYKLGLITDGRSVTQRNKLKALNIEGFFDKIIVSEEFGSTKPDERNYKAFIVDDIAEYFYIADNPKKDFLTPNKLGWTSICLLDKGNNIHPQNFDLDEKYLPKFVIENIKDILKLI